MYRGLGVRRRRAPAAKPPPRSPSRTSPLLPRKRMRGAPCLLPASPEKSQRGCFFPVASAMPAGPHGLISCLQKAVTVVDLCDVTVVEKCTWGRLAHVPGGRSPHLCVSRSEGAGLVRPLDNLARSRPPGVSVATGLTAREENLEFTGEEMGSSASSSCSPLSPGQGPPQQL